MAEKSTDQAQQIRDLVMETARVQLAALNAGIVFWSGWVEKAAKFAQSANNELLVIAQQGTAADESVSRLTDASREYLRSMSELPALAAAHFTSELEKSAAGKTTRAVRVKE